MNVRVHDITEVMQIILQQEVSIVRYRGFLFICDDSEEGCNSVDRSVSLK